MMIMIARLILMGTTSWQWQWWRWWWSWWRSRWLDDDQDDSYDHDCQIDIDVDLPQASWTQCWWSLLPWPSPEEEEKWRMMMDWTMRLIGMMMVMMITHPDRSQCNDDYHDNDDNKDDKLALLPHPDHSQQGMRHKPHCLCTPPTPSSGRSVTWSSSRSSACACHMMMTMTMIMIIAKMILFMIIWP